MTLILWKAPVVDDPDEAKALLTPYYVSEDDSAFEPSGDLAIVLERLLEKYPFDPETVSAPWADEPDNTGRLLWLDLRWGGDGRILADITALARLHGLVLYDPQGPDVFLPTDPIEELTADPKPGLLDWLKVCAMVAVIGGLTYAAWQIPIGWLRWPLGLIGAFFTIAAMVVLGAMIASVMGYLDAKEQQ